MADAYKCQDCGTVVERPQRCPDCGEQAMRPVRVPDSELEDAGQTQPSADEESPAADASDVSSAGEWDTRRTTDTESVERTKGTPDRSRTDSGGLLAWLKSLF